MGIFDKWESKVDEKALKASAEEMAQESEFAEVPKGQYEVAVDTIEHKKSKSGNESMLSNRYKILAGEFKGSLIFYNKIYERFDFMRKDNAKLLGALVGNAKVVPIANDVLKLNKIEDVEELLMDIQEEIDGTYEYLLSYTENSKGYDVFEIKEIFEVE